MQVPQKPFSKEDLWSYVNDKSVSIIFDDDDSSDEARMGSPYSYEKNDKVLKIVTSVFVQQDKPLLLEIIRKIHEDGGLIWSSETVEALRSYSEFREDNKDAKTVEFFQTILSLDDFNALKMSLFMRDQMRQKKNVSTLKSQIRERYGERGACIANLCTTGYFENEFMPLYNQLSQSEFSEYYEKAVGLKARALFVHSGMSVDDIKNEFDKILTKAIRYHMRDFRIHGLGRQNVTNIKAFVAQVESQPDVPFIIQKTDEKSDGSWWVVEYNVRILVD